MQVVLCDINTEICEAWSKLFQREDGFELYNGDFRDLAHVYDDSKLVLVSAGNSFGVMGGGLDLVIAQHFPGVEEFIQRQIREEYYGELPIGSCGITPLTKEYFPFTYLIYTPTMRIPQKLRNGENVYIATRAALRAYEAFFRYMPPEQASTLRLVLPGFGGLCGRLTPNCVARSMRKAFDAHRQSVTTHEQMHLFQLGLNQEIRNGA